MIPLLQMLQQRMNPPTSFVPDNTKVRITLKRRWKNTCFVKCILFFFISRPLVSPNLFQTQSTSRIYIKHSLKKIHERPAKTKTIVNTNLL
mmetsp:Transcript_1825/g.2815  ORF Transcript_1825/g.2815 Transcript_1825/m.2815 type:complete len:91 (-) Transcript_1825:104-376(-)